VGAPPQDEKQFSHMNELLPEHIIARIAKIRFSFREVMSGTATGIHRSSHHGQSVEFSEKREYSPGDDTKNIDWRAYGRTDRLFVKVYEHETECRCFILIDQSGSMAYGGKILAAKRAAAAFSYILLRENDAVSIVKTSEPEPQVLPPETGGRHMLEVMKFLLAGEAAGKTLLAGGVKAIEPYLMKRGVIVFFSDLLGDIEALFNELILLKNRGSKVIICQMLHRDETQFPFDKFTRFVSLETGDDFFIEPSSVRGFYLKKMEMHLNEIKTRSFENGMEYFLFFNDTPVEEIILSIAGKR